MTTDKTHKCACEATGKKNCTVSRREFLFASGATAFTVMVTVNTGKAKAEQVPALVSTYPRKKIGQVSKLQQDVPVEFEYPDTGDYAASLLVKTGVESGGGIGKGKDIVAFNMTCTHQGGDMYESYKPEHKVLGPCPLHLSTYDLTRHGLLVSGQAYQSLPQVLLEVDGDDIYAVGVFGLIYGRCDNLVA
ncbi:arsenate reductase (azurin) small subunit [Flexibacterium corallicola]|uniref:arsenate reductase (azurin) small subunit n=1 Tax=Flexibacterium corallicola TaxID=3037259 RepID=UPI00286FAD69|nr:arsenate reductase (azurin) small subunit [Pseudovibrio sp. M1P-2-3]